MALSSKEYTVLCGFAHFAAGGSDPKKAIDKEFHAALESIAAKGLIEQVWVLSEAGKREMRKRK